MKVSPVAPSVRLAAPEPVRRLQSVHLRRRVPDLGHPLVPEPSGQTPPDRRVRPVPLGRPARVEGERHPPVPTPAFRQPPAPPILDLLSCDGPLNQGACAQGRPRPFKDGPRPAARDLTPSNEPPSIPWRTPPVEPTKKARPDQPDGPQAPQVHLPETPGPQTTPGRVRHLQTLRDLTD